LHHNFVHHRNGRKGKLHHNFVHTFKNQKTLMGYDELWMLESMHELVMQFHTPWNCTTIPCRLSNMKNNNCESWLLIVESMNECLVHSPSRMDLHHNATHTFKKQQICGFQMMLSSFEIVVQLPSGIAPQCMCSACMCTYANAHAYVDIYISIYIYI
jgi:hypothetical protein